MNDIVERIIQLIKERGITEYQLCKACGISQSTFTTWKTEDRVPHTMRLKTIADYLNVSIDYLVNGTTETPTYYINPEAAEIAQELLTRPELKVLFKASRKVSAEDLKLVQGMIDRLTGGENE